MSLLLRLEWANPGHFLLANPRIALSADGGSLGPARTGLGFQEFLIPDGTSSVFLDARFVVSLPGLIGKELQFKPRENLPPFEEKVKVEHKAIPNQDIPNPEVLAIRQRFAVVGGTALIPDRTITAFGGSHPLVDVTSAASIHGVALVRLRTEFVNITDIWNNYAGNYKTYKGEHKSGTTLAVLGHTGGDPLIWFASVSDACVSPPDPAIGVLAFFRPTGYPYKDFSQSHDMYYLNRYLLSPKRTAVFPDCERQDQFSAVAREVEGAIFPLVYGNVRAGFEAALANSGKNVVMLHPWPNGTDFGIAAGPELFSLSKKAIRALWALQRVGVNSAGIHMGRFGLSGFSAGGAGLWPAFTGNFAKISELYLFDVTGVSAVAPRVIQWAHSVSGAQLRMTAGHSDSFAAHLGIKKAAEEILAAKRTAPPLPAGSKPPDISTNDISLWPSSDALWEPGRNARWDHVLALLKTTNPPSDGIERANPHTRHQFAVLGSSDRSGAGALARTFLEEFLLNSGYK